ncbi:unnamed protein product [Lymnaea stagnalis]|uniref:Uncharacterized protein n=1 Tax=Lymnaea stagnalis TaxID=6523 RepID=A0AAV2HUP5_LYMST
MFCMASGFVHVFNAMSVRVCCIVAILSIAKFATGAYNNQCFQCTNYGGGQSYTKCARNESADIRWAYYGPCDGPCFYRGDANNNDLIVRGCAASLGTVPSQLPPDGCYVWNGAIFCVCWTPLCNMAKLPDKSSGVSLDAHLSDVVEPIPEDGVLRCFQCLNYNDKGDYFPQCPKDARVNAQTVFSGNCTGACFTRSFKDNTTRVARGCTDSQYGLPYPLPKDGCYDWDGDVWCLCTTPKCNGIALGMSSGQELDAHLDSIVENIVEEDGINRCYQCINYDSDGNYYKQCPKDARVRNAFLGPCNGTCFIRSYDYDPRLVARGCTDTQYNLPNPLPPDGCYKYYSEVWCVCSTSRCNGVALGKPLDVEFDAHLNHGGSGTSHSRLLQASTPVLVCSLLLHLKLTHSP